MQNIFQHSNTALAVTLATCGVPFATDQDGVSRPFIHFYDRDILRKLGVPAGSDLVTAARDCWQKGRKGQVVYSFQRTAVCERVIKAFDEHSATLKAADGNPSLARSLVLDCEPEMVAQICCQFTKNRNTFAEGWRTVIPFVAIHGPSASHEEHGKTVTIGSFKLMRIDASAEMRAKIGL